MAHGMRRVTTLEQRVAEPGTPAAAIVRELGAAVRAALTTCASVEEDPRRSPVEAEVARMVRTATEGALIDALIENAQAHR